MNTAILIKRLCSRHCKHEVFIIFLLTVIIVFANIVLLPFESFYTTTKQIDSAFGLDLTRTVFFNPSGALQSEYFYEGYAPNIHEAIESVAGTKAIIKTKINTIFFEDGQSKYNITGVIYSKEAVDHIAVLNKYSSYFRQPDRDQYIPVLANSAAAKILPVGSTQQFIFGNGEIEVTAKIVGIYDEALIPAFSKYGSFAELNAIVIDNDAQSTPYFLFEWPDTDSLQWDYSSLIIPEEDVAVSEWMDSFSLDIPNNWGSFLDLSQLIKSSWENTLASQTGKLWNFFLLTLVAFFSYGGYLYLSAYQGQTVLSIYLILGATRRKILSLFILKSGMMCLVAILLGWFLTPYVASFVFYIETTHVIGMFGTLCCTVLFCFTIICSAIAGFSQYKKASTIAIYKRGE